MNESRVLVAALLATSLTACGDDASGSGTGSGGAGSGGEAPTAVTGSGGGAGTGGDTSSTGSGGGVAANDVEGTLVDQPFSSAGAWGEFSDDAVATDRGYVSISILDVAADCAAEEVCPGGAINFTLYVIGGTRADVLPGEYVVGGVERDGLTYDVVGGAGRYDADCGTGESGFAGYTEGTVVVDSVEGGITGTIDLTTENGEVLQGHFDAIDCTGE